MASNKKIDKGLVTLIVGIVAPIGLIVGNIISGEYSLKGIILQLNADNSPSESNPSIYSSGPDSSRPNTSTSKNSTNDSPLYTAETNDSNTGETLDENESSNNDFIDDPIHNNVTEEETIEEPTNDSNPNGDADILTYESTDSDIITSSGEIIGIRVP